MSVSNFNWKAAIGSANAVCRRWVNPDIQDRAEVSVQASLMAMLFLLPPLGLASAVFGSAGISSDRLVVHLAPTFALPVVAASLLSISGSPRARDAVIASLGPMAILTTATSPTAIVSMTVISALVGFSHALRQNSARFWLYSVTLSAALSFALLLLESAPLNRWSALAFIPALAAAALFALVSSKQESTGVKATAEFDDLAALASKCDSVLLKIERNGLVSRVGACPADSFPWSGESLQGRGLVDIIHIADRPAFLAWVAGLTAVDDTISIRISSQVSPAKPAWQNLILRSAKLQEDTYLIASIAKNDETNTGEHPVAAILGKVGHELRTPLNAIAGFSEMLRDGHCGLPNDARQREYLDLINRSAGHLLAVADTMLDWSSLENKSRSLTAKSFSPLDAAAHAVSLVSSMAKAKRIGLEFNPNVSFDLFDGDEIASTQILVNLLSNAVKFTPEGGLVSLDVDIMDKCLSIKVRDTGYGMTRDQKDRVGTAFYRAHVDRGLMFDGVGLGLSIVRELVRLHFGSMQIESEVGNGTSVLVVLAPLKTLQTNIAVLHPAASDESVRIINIHEERDHATHRKTA